jgi:hypothetical protein
MALRGDEGMLCRAANTNFIILFSFQMEIAKRLNGIIAQLLPFLSQEVRSHYSLDIALKVQI